MPETVEKDKLPAPSVVKTCPFDPSETFNSDIPTVLASIEADKATLPVPSKETAEAVISPEILKFLPVA